MFAATMETATQGVETSLAEVLSHSGRLIWLSKIRLPLVQRQLLTKMRALNQKLASGNVRMAELLNLVKTYDGELIDPGFRLRELLQLIKDDSLQQRRDVQERIGHHEDRPATKYSAQIVAELKRSAALSCESYELANRVQWEVAEHDADYSVRHEGFVAESAEGLMAMLGRL